MDDETPGATTASASPPQGSAPGGSAALDPSRPAPAAESDSGGEIAPPAPAAEGDDPTWERLENQLGYYSRSSRRAKRSFQRLKVAELVVGSAVPVVAALSAPAAVTAVLAAVVVIAEGLQQ